MNRRTIIRLLGGGVVVAATGAAWALTRDPETARSPWFRAGEGSVDPRRRALSYAILAPNPHNRQPWLADLSVPGEITLTCQLDRRLVHTDPYDRQITIGLGAFLELLAMAAAHDGFSVDVDLFPQGEPTPRLDERPIARIRFIEDGGTVPDPLFASVLRRRTNRNVHDLSRPVPPKAIRTIADAARASAIDHTTDPGRVAGLRDLTWRAMLVEMTTPAPWRESLDLTRIGKAEINADPDGISLAGPMLEALYSVGLIDKDELMDPSSSVFRQQSDILKEPFDKTTAFLWLTTPGNTRADQIAAGRDYVRINLAATALGVAMQPLSQALQEFAEIAPLYAEMRAVLGVAPGQGLQMLTRIGYAQEPKPSPRWPYETRIRTA